LGRVPAGQAIRYTPRYKAEAVITAGCRSYPSRGSQPTANFLAANY